MHSPLFLCGCSLVFAGAATGQGYSTDFEALTASAAGTIITGQDGFYVPVAGSLDGNVVTYTGNTLGVPANANGGANFYAGVSQLTNIYARAQRAVTLPANGRVYVEFDVLCNYMSTGTPPNNIGSFSFQPSGGTTYLNLLSRWPTGATAPPPTWNADVIVGSATPGTTVTTVLPDPAFQGLATNVWHRWGCTIDLATATHVDFRITNGVTNVTTIYVPATPLPLPTVATVTGPITDFRLFTGGSNNLFAIDNLIIGQGAYFTEFGTGCAGSLGVPTLAAQSGSLPAIGTTFTMALGNLPNSAAIVTTGFSDTLAFGSLPLPYNLTSSGFPGCTLLSDPLVGQFVVGTGNVATWVLTIPATKAVVGVTFFHQALSLDNGTPAAAFSNGGRTIVGF
jgi:hypothetical protein